MSQRYVNTGPTGPKIGMGSQVRSSFESGHVRAQSALTLGRVDPGNFAPSLSQIRT
jgi:hypothetical protein